MLEVVPEELRHKLCVQWCFEPLSGLGQSERMTLEAPEEHDRIDDFIELMREFKESVAYLELSLASLLTRVILPPRDEPIFVKMIMQKLGLSSVHEQLAEYL